MWHPSSKTAADCAPGGREAVEANRRILTQDPSWVRNVVGWRHPLPDRGPLVTVAIATRDRAGLLRETLASVLLQTVEDFEVVVVDDGSQDSIRDVVESFADPRLRYARQDPAGISAARNHALDISRGRYTAVLDDDDLMHPRRLEWQLAALEGDAVGTVGAFVNFDDTTGTTSLCLGRRPVREATSGIGGAPGHGTWMIRTDVMRAVRYDETLATGVDNDFMLRLLRTGAHLVHTGKALTLRRLHPQQVSRCQTSGPSAASRRSLGFLDFRVDPRTMEAYEESLRREGAFPHVEDTSALVDSIRPYLPDGLVRRELDVDCSGVEARELELLRARLEGRGSLRSLMVDGRLVSRHLLVSGATYEDMGVLRRAGLGWEAAVVEACDDPAQVTAGRHDLGWLAEVLSCGPIGRRRWRCVVVLPGGRGEPSPQDPAVEVHELCRRVEDREERWCLWLVMEPIDVLALPGAQGAWFVVGDPAQDPTGPDQEVPA
ncbi:glycosyltransferase family 2 protein [Actinomyces howellii]|uniref:glycosyltransferase family 2 protein n=1 Tax=Actinomyces howellii TaxID=52771 RepID=UPI0013752235|nr:glycosyltransferase family 2 protein [Actinomyces howellii]